MDNFHLSNGGELVIIIFTPTSTTKFSYDDCYQVFPFCKDHRVEVRLASGVLPEGEHRLVRVAETDLSNKIKLKPFMEYDKFVI